VGESWELSVDAEAPSTVESPLSTEPVSLRQIAQSAPRSLFGAKKRTLPFLLKLLNSGSWAPYRHLLQRRENYHQLQTRLRQTHPELHRQMVQCNLSLQVHPKPGDIPGCVPKNEAWVILEAESGAGIYLGLRRSVDRAQFEEALRQGADLSQLMEFVPVQPGDVFSIPAGTPHAVGAGILLLEPQDGAGTTLRAYDWGRGRPLHIEETLHCIRFDGPRGRQLACSPRLICKQPRAVEWVRTSQFTLEQTQLRPRDFMALVPTCLHGFFVESGSVEVTWEKGELLVPYGRSFFLPATVGYCSLSTDEGANFYSITAESNAGAS
jgi:mannose-6-phosphate isomerase class I